MSATTTSSIAGRCSTCAGAGEPVTVALINGQIDVHDRRNGELIAHPAPGERVALNLGSAARLPGDAQTAVAWRDGRLVLEDCPLSVALVSPNRVRRGSECAIRLSGG